MDCEHIFHALAEYSKEIYPELYIADKIVSFRLSNPDAIHNKDGQNTNLSFEIKYIPNTKESVYE